MAISRGELHLGPMLTLVRVLVLRLGRWLVRSGSGRMLVGLLGSGGVGVREELSVFAESFFGERVVEGGDIDGFGGWVHVIAK